MTLIRRGERVYYYVSRRVEGRVVNQYMAKGDLAQGLAALDESDARTAKRIRARELRRAALAKERTRALKLAANARIEQIESEARLVEQYCDVTEMIFRATLEAAGFHRHDRGEWRRRRRIRMVRDPGQPDVFSPEDWKFLRRAEAGDQSLLPAVRKLLHDAEAAGIGPAVIEAFCGDPARELESRLIHGWAGENLLAGEALRRKLDSLRDELAGPAPTAIERLMAERAVLCWLALHSLEAQAATMPVEARGRARFEKLVDRAHRRYLSALRSLATVRKLKPAGNRAMDRGPSVTLSAVMLTPIRGLPSKENQA